MSETTTTTPEVPEEIERFDHHLQNTACRNVHNVSPPELYRMGTEVCSRTPGPIERLDTGLGWRRHGRTDTPDRRGRHAP